MYYSRFRFRGESSQPSRAGAGSARRMMAGVVLALACSFLLPHLAAAASVVDSAEPRIVFGNDDRVEVFEVGDPDVQLLVDSVAVLADYSELTNCSPGGTSCDLITVPLTDLPGFAPGLCVDEPFRLQPTVGFCSGFIVGPDLIATAGHCVNDSNCPTTAVIFDFQLTAPATPATTQLDTYYCQEVIDRILWGDVDYAVLRVDRPIAGRAPLCVASSEVVTAGEQVFVIGHPVTLPAKVADSATVGSVTPLYLSADLDTAPGNSGSPIFHANSNEVLGVLVRGPATNWVTDWSDPQNPCYRENVCAQDGTNCLSGDPTYGMFIDGVHATLWGEGLGSACGLSLDLAASPTSAQPGDVITYTLTVTNATDSLITGIQLSDPVPVGTSYVPGSASDGGVEGGTGTVSWPLLDLPTQSAVQRSFQVSIDPLFGKMIAFQDGMEYGPGLWSVSHGGGDVDWQISTDSSYEGANAWRASNTANTEEASDQYLDVSVEIPQDAVLRFWHEMGGTAFSYSWGGVVEISTDGVVWQDIGDTFEKTGYTGSVYDNPATGLNPLDGRLAYVGVSGGYLETIINLSAYGGLQAWIRFRFAEDLPIDADSWSWTVDNVAIEAGGQVTNTAAVASSGGLTDDAVVVVPVDGSVCGNGIKEAGEACDDGNFSAEDCCHACQVTPSFQCLGIRWWVLYKVFVHPAEPVGPPFGPFLATDRFVSHSLVLKKALYAAAQAVDGGAGGGAQAARSYGDWEPHMTAYKAARAKGSARAPRVEGIVVSNSLGRLTVDTRKVDFVATAAAAGDGAGVTAPPAATHDLDRYLCYRVRVARGTPGFPRDVEATRSFQYDGSRTLRVRKPKHLCLPADIDGNGVRNPEIGLMCYTVKPARGEPDSAVPLGVTFADEHGTLTIDTRREAELCLPSELL